MKIFAFYCLNKSSPRQRKRLFHKKCKNVLWYLLNPWKKWQKMKQKKKIFCSIEICSIIIAAVLVKHWKNSQETKLIFQFNKKTRTTPETSVRMDSNLIFNQLMCIFAKEKLFISFLPIPYRRINQFKKREKRNIQVTSHKNLNLFVLGNNFSLSFSIVVQLLPRIFNFRTAFFFSETKRNTNFSLFMILQYILYSPRGKFFFSGFFFIGLMLL